MSTATNATVESRATNTLASGKAYGLPFKPKLDLYLSGMAVFLVENKLYQAHSYSLMLYSKVFREIFEKEGGVGTKEQPISLEGVTRREFEALISRLSKLSDQQLAQKSKQSPEERLQDSLDLLAVSHHFLVRLLFLQALQEIWPMLGNIPILQRLALGEKYNQNTWLFSAYKSLVERETTPTAQELEALGFDRAARLMQAREEAREAMHQHHLQGMVAKWKDATNTVLAMYDTGSPEQAVKPSSQKLMRQFFAK